MNAIVCLWSYWLASLPFTEPSSYFIFSCTTRQRRLWRSSHARHLDLFAPLCNVLITTWMPGPALNVGWMHERKCTWSLLEFSSTIGVEFGTRNIHDNDKIFEAQTWDTVTVNKIECLWCPVWLYLFAGLLYDNFIFVVIEFLRCSSYFYVVVVHAIESNLKCNLIIQLLLYCSYIKESYGSYITWISYQHTICALCLYMAVCFIVMLGSNPYTSRYIFLNLLQVLWYVSSFYCCKHWHNMACAGSSASESRPSSTARSSAKWASSAAGSFEDACCWLTLVEKQGKSGIVSLVPLWHNVVDTVLPLPLFTF